ncbi:MAG: hypothetical protein JRE65_05010 [Deltaproteobacteria bacterium]|nr:hypothetical protein [Deltaproteobacteria bacterium]
MKRLEPAYGRSVLNVSLFLQEAVDRAVGPVAALAVPPVMVTAIMDLTEWVVKEQMQHNKININTGSGKQIKDRIKPNINISSSIKPRNRININTNISIERNPGHRISPIFLLHSQTMPEEWSNSLPMMGCYYLNLARLSEQDSGSNQ